MAWFQKSGEEVDFFVVSFRNYKRDAWSLQEANVSMAIAQNWEKPVRLICHHLYTDR